MKTNFNVLEYFKGTNYDPEFYCGIYNVFYIYRKNRVEMDESTSRLTSSIPKTIYDIFQKNEKVKTMLWTERIKPCSKYKEKVKWLI